MIPQLLKLLSPKHKSSNNQCCNNSQLDYPNPSNPSLCHHNFWPHHPFQPHHCNRRKVFSLQHQKSSLHLRHLNAHQRYKNIASRPFQKRTRQLDHDVQKSRLRTFLRLKALREAAHLKCWISWDEEDKPIFLQLLTSNLETFLSSLLSPLRENIINVSPLFR